MGAREFNSKYYDVLNTGEGNAIAKSGGFTRAVPAAAAGPAVANAGVVGTSTTTTMASNRNGAAAASGNDDVPEESLICAHCKTGYELDESLYKYYKVLVCKDCKASRLDYYSLLTKTESKSDYLLTDGELKDLPFWIKANPHKSTYSNMLLYLRGQVEEFAWKKWGTPEELDKEFEKRDEVSAQRKEKKFKKKLDELRKKTRTSLISKKSSIKDHTHEYASSKDSKGMSSQKCVTCGYKLEFEEF